MTQPDVLMMPRRFSSDPDDMIRLLNGLRAYRPPPEQLRDLREEIQQMLGEMNRSALSPDALRAVDAAQVWLFRQPRTLDWPSATFLTGLEAALKDLRRFRESEPAPTARAAVYACMPERGDPRTVQTQLEQAATVLGGRVEFYHHDIGSRSLACCYRTGWQRIERLILGRQIGLLAVVTLDELVHPQDELVPEALWTTRDGVRTWLYHQGVRLACIDELARAAEATR